MCFLIVVPLFIRRALPTRASFWFICAMKPYAESLYNTKAWQHCRDSYRRSVGGLCERCRKRGLIVPGEIVHHKIYIAPENINDPAITLNPDNLELLCRDCHAEEHMKRQKRYKIDELGRVIIK